MDRVGVVMQHYKIHGGIESCVYSLVEGLNRRDIVPVVVGRLNDPSEEEGIHREIEERFGRSLRFDFVPLWIDRLRKTRRLDRLTQDASPYLALHLPFLRLRLVYDFLEALPLWVPRGRYVKYWNYYLDPDPADSARRRRRTGPMFRWLQMRTFARGYPIFLNSAYTAESAAALLGRRLPVLYPPVAVRRFWSTQDRPRRGVATWGRFAPDKRQMDLLPVARLLADEGFEEPFCLVGGTESFPAYFEAIREKIASEGLANVSVVPNRPLSEVVEILRSTAIYVHLTVNEPFGITTAEAMAAGCIPLVHDSGGQTEIVPWPELRWKALPELARKIRHLAADPDVLRTWRARCQEHVLSFAEERFQDTLLGFLDRRQS